MNNKDKKILLRERFLKLRAELNIETKEKTDEKIKNFILKTVEFLGIKGVLSFVSFNGEVDTLKVIDELLLKGVRVAVPKCVCDKLIFCEIKDRNMLLPGIFGIPEPSEKTNINTDEFKLALVPALSFDKKGNRLGYGKGYYDRFLKDFKGISAGLCQEVFLSEELPAEIHDIRVDMVVTEMGVKTVVG